VDPEPGGAERPRADQGTAAHVAVVPAPEGRSAPRRFSRARLATFRALERVCTALGGRWLYRTFHLAPGRLVARREEVGIGRGAAPFDGYRIAALSDFHAGSFVGPGDLVHACALVASFQPHLIVLLGDFVVHSVDELARVEADLAALAAQRPPDGVFAVFGNHDYRERREGEIATRLAAHGVRFLRNEGARIERDGAALVLVGIEDAEEGKVVDVAAARRGVRAGDVEVALSHNPRAARAFAAPGPGGRGAVLVLSGHTHGTQIDAPWLRRLGPAHPGVRVALGATTLLVTRGLGVVGAPLRIGARAEVMLVTLAVPCPSPTSMRS
jgi:predicted MPP superfamily phosphohydrolase